MKTPPPTVLGLSPSFGFGDRIGLATPGHIDAMRKAGNGISAIFAQQSIREMTRTERTPQGVMQDAMDALNAVSWTESHGADADHLKTQQDVDRTAETGFTFFTIDPSDHVDQQADDYDVAKLEERFEKVRDRVDWTDHYTGKTIRLDNGLQIEFDEVSVKRAAVKYGIALNEACQLAKYVAEVQTAANRDYEIELSVDETDQPTTLAEHYIIAEQCLKQDMKLVSLAPRFIGELEKGVDYIGDTEALEESLKAHAAIANQLGPYKLSLHSGSDKLSMYSALARTTNGRFHVKTAGTSYLEALRVVAHHQPQLFREICEFSRGRYDTDRATYHVHATLDGVPAPSEVADDSKLEDIYLEKWENVPCGKGFTSSGRQILHCTFGSALTDERIGAALRDCLQEYHSTYTELLSIHFQKHLEALASGM